MANDHQTEPGPSAHPDEPHAVGGLARQLNWLRAGVLGANDGIVSTAGIVMGVAGATTDRGTILVAGVAGLAAGALSMGAGEYVSVSTQRDSELALLEKERIELRDDPEDELAELAGLYVDRGLPEDLAVEVARHLTDFDALGAHAEIELGIDPDDITSPWRAAKKLPAKPAKVAPMVKAESLITVGFMPSARHAISSSRSASQARPMGMRSRRLITNSVSNTSNRAIR